MPKKMGHDLVELIKTIKKIRTTGMFSSKSYAMESVACATAEDTETKNEPDRQYCQWNSSDNTIFVPSGKTVGKLIPAVYEVDSAPNIGLYFERIKTKSEGLIRFPDTKSNRVVEEVQKFWDRENIFRDYKVIYKRGILLYGPPGSGKSCTIRIIIEDVIERGGIVINFTNPDLFISGLRALRQIQPEIPVVVIMEDIDSILSNYSESKVLNILDGVNDVDKVIFLATTNYPKELGSRIINRPSRFDKRFRIGFPSESSRKVYFEHLIGQQKIEDLNIDVAKWVKDTEDMTIAHLKELFVAVVILGDTYKSAIKTLKTMNERVADGETPMGLGINPHDYDDEWTD